MSDKANMLFDILRQTIFFTGNVRLAGYSVLVLEVSSIQQLFCFENGHTDVYPIQTLGLRDAIS